MKKLLTAGAVAGFVLLGGGMEPASAAQPGKQVCEDFGFGKVEVANGIKALIIEAPEDFVITEVGV